MIREGRTGCGLRTRVIVSLGILLLAGCHKKTKHTAHAPPPIAPHAHRPNSDDDAADGRVAGDEGEARTPSSRPQPAPGGAASQPSMDIHGAPFLTEQGLASWYGPPYTGRKAADGTVYDQNAMTAAHLTLALGTVVRVTNLTNDRAQWCASPIAGHSFGAASST